MRSSCLAVPAAPTMSSRGMTESTFGGRMRAFASTVLTLMAICLVSACDAAGPPSPAPSSAAHRSGLPQIVTDKAIRVCSTGDYRPFTYRDPHGNWSGLDIDMAHNLADHIGVRLDLVPTTWANLLTDVGNRCDIAMGGVSITMARAHQALFSTPYLHDGKAAIIRCADAAKYRDLSDIDRPGVRVVENPGGTNAEFARSHIKQAKLVSYPDNTSIFSQLTTDAADVMFTDTSEIRYQTMQDRQLCGAGLDHPFTSEQKAYLLPRADSALQQYVDQWLSRAQTDGTYAALSRTYLGQVVGP
jgi:cyclohexadienyl dehydratase